MSEGGQSKTEDPTPKKLKEARRKGQVARTPDLAAWVIVVGCSMVMPGIIRRGGESLRPEFDKLPQTMVEPEIADTLQVLVDVMGAGVILIAPLFAIAFISAIVASYVQGGLHLAPAAAKPKFSHLSPKAGLKRILGPQAWWNGAKVLIKTIVIGVALWFVVADLAPALAAGGIRSLSASVATASDAVGGLVVAAALAGGAVAAGDWAIARKRHMKQLRMTKKEVFDEHKSSEGDPHVKGQRRSRQLAMSRNRMMSEIATADVVLVNPTHVAVALKYDPDRGAPRVVAKGSGHVATRIREKATEHRIPMVADIPLARAIHSSCEIGQEIPAAVYTAVAQVLAFVMSLRAKGSAAGIHKVAS